MMFKYSKNLVPLPIVELFARNYELHITILDKANRFILQLAETKRSTKFYISWHPNLELRIYKNLSMPVLNILRNYLSKIIQFHIE